MKKIITGCLSFWLGLIAWASGTTGQYVELRTGVCMPQEKDGVHYKKAPCCSAEYGFSWDSWRLGLQIGYLKYENKDVPNGKFHNSVFGRDLKDRKFTALTCMVNVYYNWQLCERTNVFIGCGLGVTRLNYRFYDSRGFVLAQGCTYNQDKCLLAGQVMCGVAYDLNDHWSVSLGYRCMKMETVKYNTIDDASIWPSLKTPFLHSLEVGLRYNF